MDKIKPYEETHQQGLLTFDQATKSMLVEDFGIQIAGDGRIWICINGVSYMRFKPMNDNVFRLYQEMENEE